MSKMNILGSSLVRFIEHVEVTDHVNVNQVLRLLRGQACI